MLFLAGLINTAHAEQCTAYEFIHVKLDPEPSIMDKLAKAEPLELHQFHGLNDGSHEDFNVGVSDYNESHVCALFLQDEQTGMQRDSQGVVWIQEWQIIKKNGESLAKDLPNHWPCTDVDEGDPECDCGSMTGPKYDPTKVYAGIFQQPYTNADSASGDKTLSKSGSEYRPKYDILCADDGKWHVCDKGGCECVEVTEGKSVGGAYACVSGSWVFCDRGCNEENKCNEPEAAEVCEDETLNVNDYVDVKNPGAMCGIERATLNDIGTGSRAAATVIVEYTDGTEIKKVIECDDELNEIAVDGEKTCSIECKDTFILGETRTATINLCYQLPAPPPVEDPTPKPVEDPDPYVPIVPEEEEVPEEEPLSYWEPDPVCEEFYAVLRVETQGGIVNVTDPCPYTKRILIDRTKGCAIVENFDDFPEDSYEIIDFPPCSSSMNLMEYMLQDVLGTSGLASGSAIWKPETSTCVGRIFEVKSHLKDESEEIELNVTILNTDEDDEECEYKIGLYNKEDEEITSEDWKELTAGEYHSIEIDSTSASSVLSFRRILSGSLGWSVKDLGGEYTVKLFSKKQGGDEALVDKQTLTVCKDDAFELCRTNITIKRKLIGSNYIETSQEKHGVVDVDEWMALEAMSRDENQTFYWMLDNQMYTLVDAELCRTVNAEGTQSEIEFLTIINDPVYREIVQENYSKEPFYNKFKSMNEDPDFTYCYKTEVRDAIECGDLNYNWYSINKNGEDPIEITAIYKRDVKEWNQFQDINELTPLDEGVENIPIDYAPTACAISMDRDFYRPEDSNGMVVTYSNAPENCALMIYAKKEESDYSGPDDKKPYITKETLQVSGSGSYKYNFTGVDTQQNWSARLYCWDSPNNKICDARDQAKLNYTSISNVMSRIFMVSPLLEDTRNEMYWTRTGDGSIYVGAGFERYDRCELSCDGTNYGNNPCDLLTGCTNSGGSSSECDACLGEDCDRDSPGCPSSYKGDCWDSICRVETREYTLEAEPNAESFYGIPYKGDCPDVSDFRRKEIDMYERVWTPTIGGMPAKKETKCVLPGGVLAVTKINFPQPKGPSPLVDMAFAIDTSGSMGGAWGTVCNVIDTVVTKLKERDIDLQYTIYGLGTKQNCATASIPGHPESWGPGSTYLAASHPWREGARRVVVPISDEEMYYGDGGTDWSDADIQAAADIINQNDATVYGLWVGGKTKIIHEMKFLSQWTDGKASLFSDAQTVTELLIEMAIPEDPPVVVANNASLKAEKRDDDGMVWEIFQEDDTEFIFEVEGVEEETEEETPVGEETGEETSEPVTLTRPPDFTIIEKGNMPFKIPYTNIEKTGNTYTITRIYVPEDSKDYGKRLVVTSDILMNYTLMESSKIYVAEANTTYVSHVRKDKYYVSCDYDKCDISGSRNYGYSACGGVSSNLLSSSLRGEAREYRKDIESELIDLNYTETHRLEVPGVSHDDIPCRTLKQLKIEGTLDLVEVDDSIVMYSPIDDPFRITIYPDILSGFVLKVNNSYISYTNTLFPVRHQLVRRGSSAGADIEWRNFHDNYASLDERFDFPKQCKNICPFESCTCPVDDRMDNTCLDPDTLEDSHRTDCVCVSEGCYPNPCVTNRTYHEEEGSIIVNGDFESDDLDDYWKTNDGSITGIIGDELSDLVTGEDAESIAYGHPGRVLKLNGAIEQAIPALYARPFNQICLEYAVLEELGADDEGKLDMEVTVIKGDGTEDAELFNIWDNSGDCRDKLGWNRKCVTVKDAIRKVKLESDVEVLVDNVNAGNFYDFASIYTYDLSNIEYMDNYMKGWESGGLFGVDRVDHIGNMYTFHARTFPRITMEVHNFNIDPNFMDSIEKGTITPALKSELAKNGLELSEYAIIDKTGVPEKQEWKLVDRGLTYEISTGLDPETGDEVLNIYSSGLKKAHFTEEDFRNGLLIIQTYYGDIEIPLAENVFESGEVTEEEPEAAKKLLDMVFVIDSSSSMNREWENLCDNINDIVSTLKSDGVTLKPTIYHLGADKNPSDTCSLDQGIIITVDENGDVMTDEKGEAWVLGTKWAAENHAWTEGYGRVLIPISDTEIIHGSDRTNQDVSCAKDAANANDVTVHGLYGIETLYDDDPSQEMIELSTGTGGSAEQIDSMDSATFAEKIKDIAKEEAVEKIEEETVESSGLCYTLNLTFRKPTRVSIKTDPSGFTIPKGTRVTVTGTLTFMDGTPVPNEKLYVTLEGASVWDCEPIGLHKEYLFDFREIAGSREQQGTIREILNLYELYVNDIPLDEAMEAAAYSKTSDDNISITSSAGDIGRLEIIDGVAYFISTEELAIPLGASGTREGEELIIYPSEEDQDVAYMITDANGQASFTFKPRGTSVQVGTTGGQGAPSTSSVGFHTIGINSPLFSREFLMLAAILVLGVFSYRYFRDKRLDIYSWWQDYKGKK